MVAAALKPWAVSPLRRRRREALGSAPLLVSIRMTVRKCAFMAPNLCVIVLVLPSGRRQRIGRILWLSSVSVRLRLSLVNRLALLLLLMDHLPVLGGVS